MGKAYDNQTYQTGHTAPPKSKGGIVAVLLTVIILLGGVISILGLLNIHMFRQLMGANNQKEALAEVAPDQEGVNSAMEVTRGVGETIVLNPSPLSPENIPQEGGLSLQEIYSRSVACVVAVKTDVATATGIVLTSDGYILTNSYILQGQTAALVQLHDGTQLEAVLIAKDSFSDLAVLWVEAEGLIPASFGDSTALRVGDAVVAMGSSISGQAAMADGIIAAIDTGIRAGGSNLTLIRTNARENLGSIGGPLINCYGQVVGINSMCAANVMSLSENEQYSYALDSVTVKQVADQLIDQGFVSGRIYLGIRGQEIDSFYENYYHIPQGIFITELDENSVLFQKGVREGDILLNLDDTRILNFDTLNNMVSGLERGQEVTAVVYRDGTNYQLTITIGEEQ